MNWLALLTMIGGFAVGYLTGGTRAHIANARHLDKLNRWIETQSPGARPPLDRGKS